MNAWFIRVSGHPASRTLPHGPASATRANASSGAAPATEWLHVQIGAAVAPTENQ